jgi:zinc protease
MSVFKARRLGVGLLGLALVAASATPSAAAKLPFKVTVSTLDNGVRLVMVPYDSPGLVAYYSLVRVGSRDEVQAGVTGFAHFFEHMMFRGTKQWPPERVTELLKKAGADQNGFTTDDFTCYTFLGSRDHLNELIDYEADRFANLAYSEADFKTEAGAVYGEYKKSTSRTYLPLQERIRQRVFKRHTYGHTTLGLVKDIKDMPNQYEYSKTFFKRFYTPDNLTLVVVGDFKPEALQKKVQAAYGPWKGKRATSMVRAESKQRGLITDTVSFKETTLPRLSMSWRTPAAKYGSTDTAVANVLWEVLFGKVSALYTDLVLQQQTVAEFSDWNWDHRDPYYFHVVATVKAAKALPAVQAKMQAAVDLIAKGELSPEHLEAVKSHVSYGALLGLNTPDRIALALARSMGPTGQVDSLQRGLDSIEALSVADVQKFVKRYLKKNNQAVVTLSSAKGGR